MSLLTGGEQANVVRGDDLKVRPTEYILRGSSRLQDFQMTTASSGC